MRTAFDGREYEVLRGGDVHDGGVYLEMNDVSRKAPVTVLLVSRSDVDGRMRFSAYREDLPLELVAWFINRAQELLAESS